LLPPSPPPPLVPPPPSLPPPPISPGLMSSQAVSFRLEFPARRQLQSAVDPSSSAFQLRVRAQVAASLTPPILEANVLVSSSNVARVLEVSIIGFEHRDVTPAQVVADATSSRFLTAISNGLGSTVNMKVAPAIAVRFTSKPSPLPAPPPSPPTPPPTVPLGADGVALSQSSGSSDVLGGAGQQLVWLIIGGGIAVLLVCGCFVAYCLGKRSSNTKAVVGRPALRRHAEDQATIENAGQAAPLSPREPTVTNVRVEDLRLLELGMAVQRAQATTAAASPGSPVSATGIALKLEGMQAALDNVRDSLSPVGEHQLSPRVIDTRIRASADLYP